MPATSGSDRRSGLLAGMAVGSAGSGEALLLGRSVGCGVGWLVSTAREAGVKPIVGCEIYIAPGSRLDRNTGDRNNYHLILLAKNHTGYQNLIQLTTKAHLEGFYYRPRVDKELLEQHRDGLIALSACLAGEIPQYILSGRLDDAKQAALWYKQIFKDYYEGILQYI